MAGCTERKSLVQVLARKVKVKRCLIAENIVFSVAAELAHPVGEVDDRTVRNDDSLRRTGRTRGEQQVNRVNIQYALTDGLQQVCVSRCCKALVHRDERGTVASGSACLRLPRRRRWQQDGPARKYGGYALPACGRQSERSNRPHTARPALRQRFGRAADQNRDRLVQRIDGSGKVRAQTCAAFSSSPKVNTRFSSQNAGLSACIRAEDSKYSSTFFLIDILPHYDSLFIIEGGKSKRKTAVTS